MPTISTELKYGVMRYDIYRGLSAESVEYIDTVSSATTEYVDTYNGFVDNVVYYYKVNHIGVCESNETILGTGTCSFEYFSPFRVVIPIEYNVNTIHEISTPLGYIGGPYNKVGIYNGDFEMGDFTNWDYVENLSISTDAAHTGTYGASGIIQSTAEEYIPHIELYRYVDVTYAKEITFYYKLTDVDITGGGYITVEADVNSINGYSVTYYADTIPTDWVKATVDVSNYTGTVHFHVAISANGSEGGGV